MDAYVHNRPVERTYEILRPTQQSVPLVFASPHSGSFYPPEFIAASRLDPLTLRRSEDSFVDEIFAAAPEFGAPLICALFPRAYIDPNREPFELDPTMFAEPLPDYVNVRSPRVAAGLGTIARVVASGAEIYPGKLSFAEARYRVEHYYTPYHEALATLIETTRQRFGHCLLVDCHSMPSIGGAGNGFDVPGNRVDFVLGDCHGASCAPAVTARVRDTLRALGYRVALNEPYSGGFVTRHYGRPREGLHSLQIEINRALYMDERRIRRKAGLAVLAERMQEVILALGQIAPEALAA